MGFLSNTLEKIDTKGLLKEAAPVSGYPTQLYPLDFRNGYEVNVYDDNGKIIDRWANIGLFGGTFITVTGKTGTAKSAYCTTAAAAICAGFDEAEIHILDIEGSYNVSRIIKLTGYDYDEYVNKVKYHDEFQYIEDVFEFIVAIGNTKLNNKEVFAVENKRKNEFGMVRPAMAPTVIILDSLPMVMTKELEGIEGMATQMYNQRRNQQISQFYKRLRPIMRKANITVFVVNHLNPKIETNPFAKTQAQIMYMAQDEAMPGGNAPLYLAQTVLKFIYCGKFTIEKDGFDGFAIRVLLVKSKTNRAGTTCTLIYDSEYGFDKYRTMFYFLKEHELIEGRNPYLYIKGMPDMKFSSKDFHNACEQNFDLFKRAVTVASPILYGYLGNVEDLESYSESNEEILKRMGQIE